MDELRGDGDLRLTLEVSATRLEVDPVPRLSSRNGQFDVIVAGSDWLKALRHAQKGSFLEVLLPLTGDPTYVNAVQHVASARQLLLEGLPKAAVAEVRQAVEIVRRTDGIETLTQNEAVNRFNAARSKPPTARTREEAGSSWSGICST